MNRLLALVLFSTLMLGAVLVSGCANTPTDQAAFGDFVTGIAEAVQTLFDGTPAAAPAPSAPAASPTTH